MVYQHWRFVGSVSQWDFLFSGIEINRIWFFVSLNSSHSYTMYSGESRIATNEFQCNKRNCLRKCVAFGTFYKQRHRSFRSILFDGIFFFSSLLSIKRIQLVDGRHRWRRSDALKCCIFLSLRIVAFCLRWFLPLLHVALFCGFTLIDGASIRWIGRTSNTQKKATVLPGFYHSFFAVRHFIRLKLFSTLDVLYLVDNHIDSTWWNK